MQLHLQLKLISLIELSQSNSLYFVIYISHNNSLWNLQFMHQLDQIPSMLQLQIDNKDIIKGHHLISWLGA